MRLIRYISGVVLCASLLIGCSTRQVYQASANSAAPLANAVNINTASLDEIEKLPHIGRKTAEAIIAFRQEYGPFRRAEHLLLIRGVSEKRFSEIRQFLSVR